MIHSITYTHFITKEQTSIFFKIVISQCKSTRGIRSLSFDRVLEQREEKEQSLSLEHSF
uniref:Uncharacterized protein n=1 Tax=Arundo donax TaxID=35708 RepID=A0A0A8YX06_ARUDO